MLIKGAMLICLAYKLFVSALLLPISATHTHTHEKATNCNIKTILNGQLSVNRTLNLTTEKKSSLLFVKMYNTTYLLNWPLHEFNKAEVFSGLILCM